ncbi:carbohydrate esterase family 3 protein [Stipitochalara longipes BDJ]|nr:carbohydrate esterase family 3 protein [Stipitochalara longipes BDJ]
MPCVKIFLLVVLFLGTVCAQKQKIRYMPFGDSITEIVCWRGLLWTKLQEGDFTNIDFVGSGTNQNPAGCSTANYDKDNEGHSGFLAIDIANKKQLVGWLQKNPADIITMHLGTNDVGAQHKTEDIITAFTTLIKVMRDSNPNMKIIVAKIIPATASYYQTGIKALNEAIPAWASSMNTTQSPIWVVDQNTGMSSADERDGLHPNAAGDAKMAAVWYPAIVQAVNLIELNATITHGVTSRPFCI